MTADIVVTETFQGLIQVSVESHDIPFEPAKNEKRIPIVSPNRINGTVLGSSVVGLVLLTSPVVTVSVVPGTNGVHSQLRPHYNSDQIQPFVAANSTPLVSDSQPEIVRHAAIDDQVWQGSNIKVNTGRQLPISTSIPSEYTEIEDGSTGGIKHV